MIIFYHINNTNNQLEVSVDNVINLARKEKDGNEVLGYDNAIGKERGAI